MPTRVNMHEAKSNLSKLVERAERGEEIVICRAGTPAVRLVPEVAATTRRAGGQLRGQIWIADDFDDSDDIRELMENGPVFPPPL